MGNMSPLQKRKVADMFLEWLKYNEFENWPHTYTILLKASEELNQEVYVLWKAYDLLRAMGRIVLNSPNGRKGAHVASFTPLMEPIPDDSLLCSRANCPILKGLDKVFQQR